MDTFGSLDGSDSPLCSGVLSRESPPLNGPVEVNGPPPKKLQSTAFPIRRQKNVTIQWPVFIKKVGGPFKGGLSLLASHLALCLMHGLCPILFIVLALVVFKKTYTELKFIFMLQGPVL